MRLSASCRRSPYRAARSSLALQNVAFLEIENVLEGAANIGRSSRRNDGPSFLSPCSRDGHQTQFAGEADDLFFSRSFL